MNKEFSTVKVTSEGISKISLCRSVFDKALEDLKALCPEGRELALVKTKLEEASFFAIKSISYANVGTEDSYNSAAANNESAQS